METFGDLHTHTAHSREMNNFLDIRLKSYAETKKRIPNLGIVGVLDHDTLNYLEPMYRAKKIFSSEELPILLPGIEITSAFDHPIRKKELVQTHILGYFPNLIQENKNLLKQVNDIFEPTMRRVLEGKLRKNLDVRLEYFFKNGIISNSYDFDELKSSVLKKYEQDKIYVSSMEPKTDDIINWPLNSSDKMVLDVLLEKGIIQSQEEGKLYADRVSDERIERLGEILANKYSLKRPLALEEARKLQGSCHGDYNDDYYKISTQEAISLIRKAGGISLLAHPMVSLKKFKDDRDVFFSYCKKELVSIGLQGMEAFYPKQGKLTFDIINFCEENGLYISGGSDDHQDGRNNVGEEESRCPMKYITEMF